MKLVHSANKTLIKQELELTLNTIIPYSEAELTEIINDVLLYSKDVTIESFQKMLVLKPLKTEKDLEMLYILDKNKNLAA